MNCLLNSEMVLQLIAGDLDKVDLVVEFKASDKIPTDEKYYEDWRPICPPSLLVLIDFYPVYSEFLTWSFVN